MYGGRGLSLVLSSDILGDSLGDILGDTLGNIWLIMAQV